MLSASARPRFRLSVGIALLAALPFAGIAAVTASGFESAGELRTATQAWLDRHVAQSKRIEALDLAGVIAVERTSEGWRIGLPSSRLRLAEDGGSLRVADADFRLAQREDGLLDLAWNLPATIAYLPPGASGEAGLHGRLEIAKRAGGGIYAPRYGTFLAFDTLIEGLALARPERADMTIAQLDIRGESRPTGPDRFDSSGTGRVSGLTFAAGPTTLRLAGLRLDAALDGLRLDPYADALSGLADGDAGAPALLSFRSPLSDAAAVRLELDDLAFGSGPRRLALSAGQATIALDGLRGARSALVLRLVLHRLQTGPLSPLIQGLLPRDLDLDLELQGLPNAALGDLFAQFSTVAAAAGTRYAAGLTLTDLWKLMQRSGIEAQLDLPGWEADMLGLRGTARLTPRAGAALGFEGELRFEIERLPMLIEHLRRDQQGQRLVQLLTLVQGLGIPADPAQPAGTRRYTVLVAGDGRLDVNGTDVMPLIAGSRP